MNYYAIILFDCSDSMLDEFGIPALKSRPGSIKGKSKFDEAKNQVISWLGETKFRNVTIVPFNTRSAEIATDDSGNNFSEAKSFIKELGTGNKKDFVSFLNYASRLSIAGSEIRIIIISDNKFLKKYDRNGPEIRNLSGAKEVTGIFLNGALEKVEKLKEIAGAGNYVAVADSREFLDVFKKLEQKAFPPVRKGTASNDGIENPGSVRKSEGKAYSKSGEGVLDAIEDHNSPEWKVGINYFPKSDESIHRTSEPVREPDYQIRPAAPELNKSIHQTFEPDAGKKAPVFSLSVAHPQKLSKRYNSVMIVSIYAGKLKKEIEKQAAARGLTIGASVKTEITKDAIVCVKISSQDIEFQDEKVIRKLGQNLNNIEFLVKPKENCHVGRHLVKVGILDEAEKIELTSLIFEVEVVDLIGNFISRPLLTKIVSFATGFSGIIIFLLGFLQKINTTLGVASGTSIALIAGLINIKFLEAYRPSHKSGSA